MTDSNDTCVLGVMIAFHPGQVCLKTKTTLKIDIEGCDVHRNIEMVAKCWRKTDVYITVVYSTSKIY